MAKRVTIRDLAAQRALVRAKVRAASRQAETLGFRIYPATQRLLTQYVTRAIGARKITPAEADRVCAALLGAAMQLDADKRIGRVDTRQLKRGWYQGLAPGPGNCPPHMCASSIIGRFDSIQKDYPMIASLSKMLDEK